MFRDKRSGKFALVAHCILNQNSRVFGLAEKPSAIDEVARFLIHNKLGIVQMQCPELVYAGLSRQPQTKDEYDNVAFKRHCRKIAEEIANQVQEYESHKVKLKLVIGVDGSPSCGVKETLGVFMEELRFALDCKGISPPFYGICYKSLRRDMDELKKSAM